MCAEKRNPRLTDLLGVVLREDLGVVLVDVFLLPVLHRKAISHQCPSLPSTPPPPFPSGFLSLTCIPGRANPPSAAPPAQPSQVLVPPAAALSAQSLFRPGSLFQENCLTSAAIPPSAAPPSAAPPSSRRHRQEPCLPNCDPLCVPSWKDFAVCVQIWVLQGEGSDNGLHFHTLIVFPSVSLHQEC